MQIIGITGILGSGKGTVVECLKEKGYKHYSARSFFIKKLQEEGLPIDGRTAFHDMANRLRKEHGAAYVVEELVKEAQTVGGDAIVESIHTVGEVEALKRMGALLLGVDANRELRYERILKRKSETEDNGMTFERFVREEEIETKNEDPLQQNLSACLALADAVIMNNGSLEDLHKAVDEALEKLG